MSSTTRARTIAASLAAVLALGGLAACGSDSTSSSSATTTATGELTVTGAWARESAMAAGNGAVYFTITNGGSTDDELVSVSVSADVAAMAQIHETVEASSSTTMGSGGMTGSTEGAMSGTTMAGSGMMTMQEVASVAVPAGATVTFAPGGYHVMLVELVTPLEVGTTVPLTLHFTKLGDVQINAEVRAS
jgi:copper(I)-binding protein